MVVRSFGHNGNMYIRRGYAQEFGQDIFDHGKFTTGHVNPYSQNNGQMWNEHQGGYIFNPYQKLGYTGYLQNQGFNGDLGFRDGSQFVGVPQPVNFVGIQRHRT